MRRTSVWFPNQHGAWAMLAVPAIVGLLNGRHGTPHTGTATDVLARLALVSCFFVGFLAFHAATLGLKFRGGRRAQAWRAAGLYAIAAAAVGLVSLAAIGPPLLWWAFAYVPLLTIALLAAAGHRERSVASGAATTGAASLIAATVAHPHLPLVEQWPLSLFHLVPALICFLYFFGTVWVVKTMIRKRGSRGWYSASIVHHVVATLVAAGLLLLGGLHPVFIAFFAATTVRAILLPLLGPLADPPRMIRPRTVGLVEVAFSTTLVVIFALLGTL